MGSWCGDGPLRQATAARAYERRIPGAADPGRPTRVRRNVDLAVHAKADPPVRAMSLQCGEDCHCAEQCGCDKPDDEAPFAAQPFLGIAHFIRQSDLHLASDSDCVSAHGAGPKRVTHNISMSPADV